MPKGPQPLKLFLLYALPLLGAGLALGTIDLIVPRQNAEQILAAIKTAPVTLSADVIAAFYYMALSGTLVVVVCAASLWWCLTWIYDSGYRRLTSRERSLFWLGLIFAIGFPLLVLAVRLVKPGCDSAAIDDCVTRTLFSFTIQRVYASQFAFVWDADLLASLVFTTYLVSTLTVATAVGPASNAARIGTGAPSTSVEEGVRVLNSVLLLTAVVLIAAMLAARFRFDVGLATLGAPPTKEIQNPGFVTYQTVASAIMVYWATFLSLCLALIYVPGAYLLSKEAGPGSTLTFASWFTPSPANFTNLLKFAAILSPPIINKVVELIGTAPKGF